MPNPRNIILGLLVSTLGGMLCAWLNTPLPWMIGPLLAMAICNFSGARLAAPPLGREFGQLVIAVTLGLYFTPTDDATAFFASVPGGATEMANLGDRFGAAVDKVAVAHSLRILMVVCTIPVLMTMANVHGGDQYRPVVIPFNWIGLFELLGIAAAGALMLTRLGFPNAWMMGPLIAIIVTTATGHEFSSMLGLLTNCGQVLLACALGMRFSRQFLRDAPRFVTVVLASIVVMICLSAVIAWGLAWLGGISVPTMILAAAPGGIAEMSITARALQLGVALVTAAHVTRVIILISLSLPTFRLIQRLHGKNVLPRTD